MPIYAYRCESCGHERDVLQKVSDAPLTVCPACGRPALRKQLTAAGFQLKGSGWYVTDFRDKGRGKPAAKPGEAAAGAGETGKAGDAAAAPGPAAGSDSAASGAAASGTAASGATASGTKAAAPPAGASPAGAKPD